PSHHHPPPCSSPTRRSSDLRNGGIAPYVELITQLAGSESPLRYLPEPNEHPGHLPIAEVIVGPLAGPRDKGFVEDLLKQHKYERSEEHTSELQSRFDLVCRL